MAKHKVTVTVTLYGKDPQEALGVVVDRITGDCDPQKINSENHRRSLTFTDMTAKEVAK